MQVPVRYPVQPEPPVGLQSYLHGAERAGAVELNPALIEPAAPSPSVLGAAPAAQAPASQSAGEAIGPLPLFPSVQRHRPAWMELLLWLALLLIDGAMALGDLLVEHRRRFQERPQARQRRSARSGSLRVMTWLRGELNASGLV